MIKDSGKQKFILMNERKVGEIFNDGSVKLKVTIATGCNGCFYNNLKCFNNASILNRGSCASWVRSDEVSVIFKQIK